MMILIFAALTRNIRYRRGGKVDIKMPLYHDINTPEFIRLQANEAKKNLKNLQNGMNGVSGVNGVNIEDVGVDVSGVAPEVSLNSMSFSAAGLVGKTSILPDM